MITGSRFCKVSNHIKSSFLTVQVYFKQQYCPCVFKKARKKKKTGHREGYLYGLKQRNRGLVIQRKWIHIVYIYLLFNCLWAHVTFKYTNSSTFFVLVDYSGNKLIFGYSSSAFLLNLSFCTIVNCRFWGAKAQ